MTSHVQYVQLFKFPLKVDGNVAEWNENIELSCEISNGAMKG